MNNINYNNEFHRMIDELRISEEVPSLLLHACCAPCASTCMLRVREYFKTTVFFYNPNITEREEYDKRVYELRRLIDIYNADGTGYPIKVVEGEYEPEVFYNLAKGLESAPEKGPRCHKCYESRIMKTGIMAAENGYDYFTTTLTLSPLKDARVLNAIGKRVSDELGNTNRETGNRSAIWLPSDFKKENGYKQSIELSEKYGLYRQNYCGCEYSRR